MNKLNTLFLVLFICINSFGQTKVKQVGNIFKLFNSVRDFTLLANGNEAYFTIQDQSESISIIVKTNKINGKWQNPVILNFSGQYRDIEPFITPSGLRLYFSSNRPLDSSSTKTKDYDIWYVERSTIYSDWSEPINIGAPINTTANEFYPSVTVTKNIYFTSDSEKSYGKDDIFFSKWKESGYTIPKPLNKNINSEGYEFNAFIAPNENYIIYTKYKSLDGFGSGDLYISFKDIYGNWLLSKNLGKHINSKAMDYCPFYDENTQTLYFTSRRSGVSQKNFNNVNEFLNEVNQYENGFSRIYKVNYKLPNHK